MCNRKISRLNVTSVRAVKRFVPSPDHAGEILLPPKADFNAKKISLALT